MQAPRGRPQQEQLSLGPTQLRQVRAAVAALGVAEVDHRNRPDEGQPFIATTSALGELITLRGWWRTPSRAAQGPRTATAKTRRNHEEQYHYSSRAHDGHT
jgi:hypothetical protein